MGEINSSLSSLIHFIYYFDNMKKTLLMMSIAMLSIVVLTWCNQKVADMDGAIDTVSDTVGEVKDNVQEVVKDEVEKEEAKKEVAKVVDTMAEVSDWYQDFDAKTFAKSLEEWKQVVLFFHADRCPSCIALDKKINEGLDTLPEWLVVFKLDYDQEKELKKLYKVRQQHTLVYLDTDGNAVENTTGIATVEQLLKLL